MRMREYAFPAAACEKLVYERSTGDGSLQVLPAGSVTPQSSKLIGAEELLQHFSGRTSFNRVTRGVVLVRRSRAQRCPGRVTGRVWIAVRVPGPNRGDRSPVWQTARAWLYRRLTTGRARSSS